jgi:hypothetical protein
VLSTGISVNEKVGAFFVALNNKLNKYLISLPVGCRKE